MSDRDEPRSSARRPAPQASPPKLAGRAQLTLVEHALCPLDTSASLGEGLTHRSEFHFVGPDRRRRTASARVICPLGLSPADEFYLWGLVALTLSQPDPSIEFHATPHYCLGELGVIEAGPARRRGGKDYALFRQAMTRLAAVTYLNDHFYDPVRGEHRSVAFGFLSYSLPADPRSSRAWRIVWDPIFFEYCQASRGSLTFDLDLYRRLDFASRRLFLLLKKIFYRNASSPAFDVRHLAVQGLGFSPSLEVWSLKAKLGQVAGRLADLGLIRLPEGDPDPLFRKKAVGVYQVRFRRGPYFERQPGEEAVRAAHPSPLRTPLAAIGFDEPAIDRILKTYPSAVVQTWSDITLAAIERSPGFFKVSPQAYFLDNAAHAATGRRTPPDWWYEHRKAEERQAREQARATDPVPLLAAIGRPTRSPSTRPTFEQYLREDARPEFDALVARLAADYQATGHSPLAAIRLAVDSARGHFLHAYRALHPDPPSDAPVALGDLLPELPLD